MSAIRSRRGLSRRPRRDESSAVAEEFETGRGTFSLCPDGWKKGIWMRLSTVLIAVNHRLYILPAYSKQAIHTYDWNMNDDIVLSSTPFSIFCSVVSRLDICCTTCLFILGYAYCIITIVTSSCFDSPWLSRSPQIFDLEREPKKSPKQQQTKKKKISSSSCSFVFLCDAFWLDTLFDFSISPRHVGAWLSFL